MIYYRRVSMIYIITGHYGSGKTEIAINLAQKLKNPVIVDMDIVNPYFRTADAKDKLEALGVKVIAPEFANTNVDIPSLPPEIFSALQGEKDVILDVGGDEDGAIALGQFNKYFQNGYEMYFVMNFLRPMTKEPEDVYEILKEIEFASRLKVTKLINNTNVKEATTAEIVEKSMEKARKAEQLTNIPLMCVSGTKEVLKNIDGPKMELELNLTLPWEL